MISDQFSGHVYLAVGSTDMRKAINGLSILVEQAMDLNPFSGDLFVFCNRQRTIIKILYWENNGFCLWHKRLEIGVKSALDSQWTLASLLETIMSQEQT